MSGKTADLVAAKEHSISSHRTRAHVIVCHDLNRQAHTLHEMFGFAGRVSEDVLAELVTQLANDIISDVNILIADLEGIKAFAQRQLDKLPPTK